MTNPPTPTWCDALAGSMQGPSGIQYVNITYPGSAWWYRKPSWHLIVIGSTTLQQLISVEELNTDKLDDNWQDIFIANEFSKGKQTMSMIP